jgi:hypothetical protein
MATTVLAALTSTTVVASDHKTLGPRTFSNAQTEPQRKEAAERLAADVRAFKHITTGFLGAPLICQVLSDYGHFDEAHMLLNRTEYPSWLYPIML